MINTILNSNWIKESAARNDEMIAIRSKTADYSYSILMQKINQTAGCFNSAGIVKGKNTAILLENNIDFVISLFAVWNCGSGAVPLNPNSTAEEITGNIEFTNCDRIITGHKFAQKLRRVSSDKIIFIDDIDYDKTGELKDVPDYRQESPAVIMFTSGSSGVKKAAVLTFGNLYNSSKNIDTTFNFAHGEKWHASLPFYHIGGMQIIIRSVLSGGELLIPDEINTKNILDRIKENNPKYISIVNSILQQMIEQKIIPDKGTKAVFAGGGPIHSNLLKQAVKLGIPVYKVYGSTETSSMVTLLSPDNISERIESAGKPIGDVEIKILDDDKNEVSTGKPGEIAVKGGSVISSYYNNHQLNRDKFYNGFFLTGDKGYLDEDGFLFVLGRKDNFIITGGEKVNPDEVKQAFMDLGCFIDVHILGVEDKKWGQKVCAVYILKSDSATTEAEIKEKLIFKLPSYKIPRKMLQLKNFPKTGLGKIDTIKLIELLK